MNICVDMSATLIHHGHIRLLKRASSFGSVVVALTTDDQIQKYKGYTPELSFEQRKEILESIRYVDRVIPSPWLINEEYLLENNLDLLVHGNDNSNLISAQRLKIFPRTIGVSSTILRKRVLMAVADTLVKSDLA